MRFLLYNRLVEPTAGGGLRWCDPSVVLIQCGDIPDRGSQTLLITTLIQNLRAQGAQIVTLLGNHDVAYLLAPDAAEQRRRIEQALSYMVDEEGRTAAETDDVQQVFLTQAGALAAIHRHPLGGLVALRLGSLLFLHAEPVPGAFTPADLDALATDGLVAFEPKRHHLAHPVLWGRAFSCGTADMEGGYLPQRRPIIPPARRYERELLALHEDEPAIRELYAGFRAAGIETIIHGHVPGPTVRRYEVCGIEHINIDEAICGHYRMVFEPLEDPSESTYVPLGWRWDAAPGEPAIVAMHGGLEATEG